MTDAVDLPAGSAGEQTTSGRPSGSSNWWAIFSMMLGVAALISAELLPVSMLTQMAEGLSISAGVAGQMISVTAATAMMAGLLIPGLFKQTDRRRLILCFTAMMIVACLITAAAQSIWQGTGICQGTGIRHSIGIQEGSGISQNRGMQL